VSVDYQLWIKSIGEKRELRFDISEVQKSEAMRTVNVKVDTWCQI
jgi:hypothetical protein